MSVSVRAWIRARSAVSAAIGSSRMDVGFAPSVSVAAMGSFFRCDRPDARTGRGHTDTASRSVSASHTAAAHRCGHRHPPLALRNVIAKRVLLIDFAARSPRLAARAALSPVALTHSLTPWKFLNVAHAAPPRRLPPFMAGGARRGPQHISILPRHARIAPIDLTVETVPQQGRRARRARLGLRCGLLTVGPL